MASSIDRGELPLSRTVLMIGPTRDSLLIVPVRVPGRDGAPVAGSRTPSVRLVPGRRGLWRPCVSTTLCASKSLLTRAGSPLAARASGDGGAATAARVEVHGTTVESIE